MASYKYEKTLVAPRVTAKYNTILQLNQSQLSLTNPSFFEDLPTKPKESQISQIRSIGETIPCVIVHNLVFSALGLFGCLPSTLTNPKHSLLKQTMSFYGNDTWDIDCKLKPYCVYTI